MVLNMKRNFDKNHPIVKWIDLLFSKYDLKDLIREHIYCHGVKPKDQKEAEERLMNFFVALTKEYNYTPEHAVRDIKRQLN